jgi:outer membrane protein TolC
VPYTGNTQTQNYSYGLTVRQLVFDGFQNTQDILQASETVKAAEFNYKAASAQVRYSLRSAYVGLMKAQDMIKVTAQILSLRKKQYEDVKLRYNGGTEDIGAVMSSEADFKQADFSAGQALRTLEVAKESLCSAIGRDINSDISVKEDFTITEDTTIEPDFKALLLTNLGYLAAVSQRRAAQFAFGSSVSSFLPQAYASGSVGRGAATLLPQDTTWSLGLNISFTIFDGGKSEAQCSQALAALNQAKADEKASSDNTTISLKNAWYGFKDAFMTVAVQQKYFDASAQRAKISDVQYSTGLTDFNNWTIIQNTLVSSQTAIVSAQAGLLTAEAAWIQAKGGTLEDEK